MRGAEPVDTVTVASTVIITATGAPGPGALGVLGPGPPCQPPHSILGALGSWCIASRGWRGGNLC